MVKGYSMFSVLPPPVETRVMQRNGRLSLPFAAAIILFLLLSYTYYLYQDLAMKLRITELQVQTEDKKHASMLAQLEVITRHRSDLESTLSRQTMTHRSKEEDFVSKISLCEVNITSTKAKHAELQDTYVQLQQQYTRLSSDHQRTIESMRNVTTRMQESKDNEIDTLKGRVEELLLSAEAAKAEASKAMSDYGLLSDKQARLVTRLTSVNKMHVKCDTELQTLMSSRSQDEISLDKAEQTIRELKQQQRLRCGLIPNMTVSTADNGNSDGVVKQEVKDSATPAPDVSSRAPMPLAKIADRQTQGNGTDDSNRNEKTPVPNMIKLQPTRQSYAADSIGHADESVNHEDETNDNERIPHESNDVIDEDKDSMRETSFHSLVTNRGLIDNREEEDLAGGELGGGGKGGIDYEQDVKIEMPAHGGLQTDEKLKASDAKDSRGLMERPLGRLDNVENPAKDRTNARKLPLSGLDTIQDPDVKDRANLLKRPRSGLGATKELATDMINSQKRPPSEMVTIEDPAAKGKADPQKRQRSRLGAINQLATDRINSQKQPPSEIDAIEDPAAKGKADPQKRPRSRLGATDEPTKDDREDDLEQESIHKQRADQQDRNQYAKLQFDSSRRSERDARPVGGQPQDPDALDGGAEQGVMAFEHMHHDGGDEDPDPDAGGYQEQGPQHNDDITNTSEDD